VLLPDVYGVELVNAQLLADDFAANGFARVQLLERYTRILTT
jgi:hypothetical protein